MSPSLITGMELQEVENPEIGANASCGIEGSSLKDHRIGLDCRYSTDF